MWDLIEARHGGLPAVKVAERQIGGMTVIRIDATVVHAHSGEEGAEPNFEGFGHHPLMSYCGNTAENLVGLTRQGSAGCPAPSSRCGRCGR